MHEEICQKKYSQVANTEDSLMLKIFSVILIKADFWKVVYPNKKKTANMTRLAILADNQRAKVC